MTESWYWGVVKERDALSAEIDRLLKTKAAVLALAEHYNGHGCDDNSDDPVWNLLDAVIATLGERTDTTKPCQCCVAKQEAVKRADDV